MHSICHVTLHKIENEQLIWMSNCTDSFWSTKCPHAIKIAYSIEADLKVQQYIPQIIKKSTKKRNRQEHTKKDLTKKSGESSKVPMEHKGGNNAFTGNSIRINGQDQPPPYVEMGGCWLVSCSLHLWLQGVTSSTVGPMYRSAQPDHFYHFIYSKIN